MAGDSIQRTRSGRATNQRLLTEIVGPGIVGGIVAGLAVMVVAMILSLIGGHGVLWPLELLAATVWRHPRSDAFALFIGFVLHLGVASIWGALFNSMVPRGTTYAGAAMAGLLYGLVVFLIATWLILPRMNPTLFAAVGAGWFLLLHIVYGLLVPLAIPLRRNVTEEHSYQSPRRVHT